MQNFATLPDVGQADGFQYRIDYRPAFALATVVLPASGSISAQSGAMVSMSPDVELSSRMDGGILGAIKRSVAGRSAFVSTFTAGRSEGEVTLAPPTPGDVVAVRVSDGDYNIAASGYLASDPGLTIDSEWGGARGFFGADSLFVLRASGRGVVLLTAFGALHEKQLAPGERYVIDTGHVVAWESSMQYRIRKATHSLFRSATSGEMLVAEYTGPGTVLLQTRNLQAFAGMIGPLVGAGVAAGSGAGVAGVAGGAVVGGIVGGLL
jgi:uncharacterized protein (TIGR00266 family)